MQQSLSPLTMRYLKYLVLLALLLPEAVPIEDNDKKVKRWAQKLGDELWNLNLALTKSDDIEIKYNKMNASVKKKNGNEILKSSLRSVSTMLNRKINAVKCIHATAEKLAREFNYTMLDDSEFRKNLDFQYCDAKYSKFTAEPDEEPPREPEYIPEKKENKRHYESVYLERDSHFYDIMVNTSKSCVHVPTNIYFKEKNALSAILWSEELTEIFTKNYNSDPSLSWQYFGSSHGIMRFYPGMQWNMQTAADTYDCRVKSWYIEAATCSKDVIILFDVSGSMTGFKNYVARNTLNSILLTLSNNDYVNVYYFKNETNLVVQCFQGLVQATPENLKTLSDALEPKEVKGEKEKVHKVKLEGNADLAMAYIMAFETLREKRLATNCSSNSEQGCNQLVMLITDYVPGNLTEVFEEHNRDKVGNKTYIPVRVFTYLIGKEVTNIREIQWMACLNRGYFVHIHSVEEVQQQVLKYINVIARPMILNGAEPPPTWTHANIDDTRTKIWNVSKDALLKHDEDKLVTSVAIPAFDYKYNEDNGDAVLLGVAGTDVPLESIAKLAQPHQLGVNGYSFIVSNNGYLLLHPYLIATINDELQKNYNSVDFVEVEQVDDGLGSRQLGEEIKELRKALVDGKDGSKKRIRVLFHYDQMRRIARVEHDYFYKELNGTPFSMGISLPHAYGDTELLLRNNPLEAKQGLNLTGINVTDYFRFNYRVHPDWVYCKYHYLEGHETENPEMEIWTFLVGLSRNEINITKKQYEDEEEKPFDFEMCGNATQLDKDDYYCNEDLVKQVVFDAKLSKPYFEDWNPTVEEKNLAEDYNVSVRFIATASGFTRWHYIMEPDKNEYVNDTGWRNKNYNGKVFGDDYYTAIEETWYKAAVLQHMENETIRESLVVATPLPILDTIIQNRPSVKNEDDDITVTATYAIFYKDSGFETPSSVVGFQYSYKSFLKKFKELVCDKKKFPAVLNYDFYLIDSSGYIVLYADCDDENQDPTKENQEIERVGQFFGVVDKNAYVMECLLHKKVFEQVVVFNYQALCPKSILKEKQAAWSLQNPFNLVGNFLRWMLTEILLLVINWNESVYAYPYVEDTEYTTTTEMPVIDETLAPENNTERSEKPPPEEDKGQFSCDHSITLYRMDQNYFIDSTGVLRTVQRGNEHGLSCSEACSPNFWASYVLKTNMLMVMVEKDHDTGKNCVAAPSTMPVPTESSTDSSEPCHKLDLGRLPRRRLEGCFTYNEKEKDIKACGLGSTTKVDLTLFICTTIIMSLATKLSSS